MACTTFAAISAILPEYRGSAGCTGRSSLGPILNFGLVVLALLTGGCGGGGSNANFMELTSSAQFQQQVLKARKPVLVHFQKGGCTRCASLESAMGPMTNDYRGRVVFAKYHLKNAFWVITNPELQSKYGIDAYPTVLLFVNGQERKRWIMQDDIKSYRRALDEALHTPARYTPAKQTSVEPVVHPTPPEPVVQFSPAEPVVQPGFPDPAEQPAPPDDCNCN